MSDIRQETLDTYNHSAKELAKYFRGIGSRVKDIDLAFKYAGDPKHSRVVEIGCGDGRDAKEIVKRAEWFLGFDISDGLLELAREHVPGAKFEQGDAATFVFPKQLDVVFAFASLLHLDKNELKDVLKRVHTALKPDGIFYISLKYAPEYVEEIKEDRFGRRQFFFYTPELVQQLAGKDFITELVDRQIIGEIHWFTIVLRKQ